MTRDRKCVHGKFGPYCKDCKGSMLCTHLRHKNRCAICKRCNQGGQGLEMMIFYCMLGIEAYKLLNIH